MWHVHESIGNYSLTLWLQKQNLIILNRPTASTTDSHLTQLWASFIHLLLSQLIFLRAILSLYSHLILDPPIWRFPRGFSHQYFVALFLYIHVWTIVSNLLCFITLTVLSWLCEPQSFPFCYIYVNWPLTMSSVDNTVLSNRCDLVSFLKVRHKFMCLIYLMFCNRMLMVSEVHNSNYVLMKLLRSELQTAHQYISVNLCTCAH
jgi:hypothetical protein